MAQSLSGRLESPEETNLGNTLEGEGNLIVRNL
jgi:hypothetical protein